MAEYGFTTENISPAASTADKVFSGVFWKFSERFLAQLVSFFVSLVLARILMPEDYGIIAVVTVFITLADVFVVSGFSTSLIQKKGADETDFSTIFYCSLFVALVLYAILFILAAPISRFFRMPALVRVLRVFAIRVPLAAFNSVQHAYVSRNMLFRKFFFSTLFGTVLSGAAGIFFALKGFGVWALVIQYLMNSAVDSVVLFFTISWRPKLLFSWSSAAGLMNYGWKIFAADFSGTFFDQLRNILIGRFYDSDRLAYYNRGQQFPHLISNNITTSIMSVLFPALSDETGDSEKVRRMLRRSIRVSSYLVFPLLFGMAAAAVPMIQFLLTEKWAPAIPFVQILCVSAAFSLVGSVSIQGLKAVGRSGAVLKLEFIKKPVYLLLLVLGLRISVLAVALTFLGYSVYGNIANAGMLRKYIGYKFRDQAADLSPAFLLSFFSCGLPALFQLLPLGNLPVLVFQILASVTLYLAASRIFKVDSFLYLLNRIRGAEKNG